MYRIKELAELAGVSVRTLHYYDEIGLLKPNSCNHAGYRLYNEYNLEVLQQILFFRELGFGLKEIGEILDNRNFDRKKALLSQREILEEKVRRLQRMIALVDNTISSIEGDNKMNKNDMFTGFNHTRIDELKKCYASEARELYGKCDTYAECEKRTGGYSNSDWAAVMSGGEKIIKKMARLVDCNPADKDVQSCIQEWRDYITASFYDCTLEILQGLGELYVSDERFREFFDRYGAGVASQFNKGIAVYCAKHNR